LIEGTACHKNDNECFNTNIYLSKRYRTSKRG
jgi:hypothetical protein